VGSGVVVAAVVVTSANAYGHLGAPLGAVLETSRPPDQAVVRREDFSSCVSALATPNLGRPRPFRFVNVTKFGDRPLQLMDTDGPPPRGAVAVVVAPRQEFTLYGERFAESPHVTQHESAIFHGSYALVTAESHPTARATVESFLRERFPEVRDAARDDSPPRYLVPLLQYGAVRAILEGHVDVGRVDDGRSDTEAPPTPDRALPRLPWTRPGTVRTGRGTFYDFEPNGRWVQVYRRRGPTERIELPSPEEDRLGFASHAAILARLGVPHPERLSAVEQIDAGIARLPALVAEAGVPTATRGIHAYQVRANRAGYEALARPSEGEGVFGPADRERRRDTLLWSTLRESHAYAAALPSRLRWRDADDPAFARAPTDDAGLPVLRVQRPLLLFGNGLARGEQPVELRIGETRDTLHLALAHLYFGDWALALDRDGAIAGGLLEYEYDAEPPHALRRIELADDGMISRATGSRRFLSTSASAWTLRQLELRTSGLRPAPVVERPSLGSSENRQVR
jgi:hypothetical protein